MTIKYRIFAHRGQVSAIVIGDGLSNVQGVEVFGGEAESPEAYKAALAVQAPGGVMSPWPPVPAPEVTKPSKPTKASKGTEAPTP